MVFSVSAFFDAGAVSWRHVCGDVTIFFVGLFYSISEVPPFLVSGRRTVVAGFIVSVECHTDPTLASSQPLFFQGLLVLGEFGL